MTDIYLSAQYNYYSETRLFCQDWKNGFFYPLPTPAPGRLLGAGLIVTGEAGCLDSVAAVLAPEGLTGGRRREGGALVRPLNRLFFSGQAQSSFGLTLDGSCIRLPAPYESLVPPGVSRLDFAAALYDSARPKALARLLPSYICREGLRIPLRAAAAMMAQAVRRPGAGVGKG